MAATVASPLERQFSTISGVEEMTSSNTAGATTVTLSFDLDRDIDGATVDVQTAIAAAMPLLPPTLSAPPSFRKTNPADQPILAMVLMSNTLPMSKVTDYVETVFGPRISVVPGVGQVTLPGTQRYAVRVQADPHKLQALGIGLNDIERNDFVAFAELDCPNTRGNATLYRDVVFRKAQRLPPRGGNEEFTPPLREMHRVQRFAFGKVDGFGAARLDVGKFFQGDAFDSGLAGGEGHIAIGEVAVEGDDADEFFFALELVRKRDTDGIACDVGHIGHADAYGAAATGEQDEVVGGICREQRDVGVVAPLDDASLGITAGAAILRRGGFAEDPVA